MDYEILSKAKILLNDDKKLSSVLQQAINQDDLEMVKFLNKCTRYSLVKNLFHRESVNIIKASPKLLYHLFVNCENKMEFTCQVVKYDRDDFFQYALDIERKEKQLKRRRKSKENARVESRICKVISFTEFFRDNFEQFELIYLLAPFLACKILSFITENSKELEISFCQCSAVEKFVEYCDGSEETKEEFIKAYFLKIPKEDSRPPFSVNVICNFKSINLFLFFISYISSSGPNYVAELSLVAKNQTNLDVVKWLVNKGCELDDFIFQERIGYSGCYNWSNPAKEYLDGKDLETLVFLIGCDEYGSPVLKDLVNYDSQLLFRLLVRKVDFGKIIIDDNKAFQQQTFYLKQLTEELNNHLPSCLVPLVLGGQ
jgi:hypothetical protein